MDEYLNGIKILQTDKIFTCTILKYIITKGLYDDLDNQGPTTSTLITHWYF